MTPRPEPVRHELWEWVHALQPRVVPFVARASRDVSFADLEDLWADLVVQSVGPAGAANALPTDVGTWSDARLTSALRSALARDVIDLLRKRSDREGRPWVVGGVDPLEHLAESLGAPAHVAPEADLLHRQTLSARLQDVHDLGGDDAVRLVVAEARGSSVTEQNALLGSRERVRTVRGRLERATGELRARARAAIWFFPDLVMRWMGSGGATPRIGATAIVITATLAGGASVATHAPHHHSAEAAAKRAPTAVRPVSAATGTARPAPAGSSVRQATTSRRAAAVPAQNANARKAASRRAAARRAAQRRAADQSQARAAQRSTSAAAARDEFNFEDQVAAASAPHRSSSTASSTGGSASAAAVKSEFGP